MKVPPSPRSHGGDAHMARKAIDVTLLCIRRWPYYVYNTCYLVFTATYKEINYIKYQLKIDLPYSYLYVASFILIVFFPFSGLYSVVKNHQQKSQMEKHGINIWSEEDTIV